VQMCTAPLFAKPSLRASRPSAGMHSLRSYRLLTYPALKGRRVPRDSAGQVPSSSVVGGLRLTLVWADLLARFPGGPA
jgi:hypothetical protein